jgi:hypothetical protein
MKAYTDQTAFDAVVRHLAKAPCRAVIDSACQYRTPDGGKCAIGALIPDDLYRPQYEHQGVSTLLQPRHALKVVREAFKDVNLNLLRALQMAHDGVDNWSPTGFTSARLLENIARHFGLGMTVLKAEFPDAIT